MKMGITVKVPAPKYKVGDVIKISNTLNNEYLYGYVYKINRNPILVQYDINDFYYTPDTELYSYDIVIQKDSYHDDTTLVKYDISVDSVIQLIDESEICQSIDNYKDIIKYPQKFNIRGAKQLNSLEDIKEFFDKNYYNINTEYTQDEIKGDGEWK